jgi:hypothetical protein
VKSPVVAVTVAVALALPASGARAVAGPTVVRTAGPIDAIAFEGAVAAYDVRAAGVGCTRLYVWRVRTGSKSQVGRKATCRADDSSTGRGVTRIALSRTRAAWLVNRGGNIESVDELYTSPLTRRGERRIARTVRTGEVGIGLAGGWLGGLVSDGVTIFYNRWTTSLDATGKETVVSGSLRRLTYSGTAQTAAGAETLVAQAASGARIAVLRADGGVAVYEASGQLIRLATPTAPPTGVALSRQRLVVLTTASTIEVYGVGSGPLLKTWRAAGNVTTRIDLVDRFLVYGVGTRVYVLDVVSGKTRPLASPKRRIVDVQIESAGVLYAYNSRSGKTLGHVIFVPAAAVSAALR